MSYIAAEDILEAKKMDLLTFLRNYEPQELVHVSGNTYCTREHDSLRISNGKWCWFSQGIGGRSALDYLIKVKGIPFTQAAEIILGREAEKPPVFYRQKERRSTELLMPELSETTEQVEKYLYSRGIHPVIIRYCLDNRLLFESADYHNAVFVGHDKDGKARYDVAKQFMPTDYLKWRMRIINVSPANAKQEAERIDKSENHIPTFFLSTFLFHPHFSNKSWHYCSQVTCKQ